MRIIIADDEMHVRRRLKERINWGTLGIDDLVFCDDGDEILEEMKTAPADILLTDIRMARMNGIDAAKILRSQFPKLAVILMSAYDDKEYLKSALELQSFGYLEKPFSIEKAEELIKRAADYVTETKKASNASSFAMQKQREQKLFQCMTLLCHSHNSYKEAIEWLKENEPEFLQQKKFCAVLFHQTGEEELQQRRLESDAFRAAGLLKKMGRKGICTEIKSGVLLLFLAMEMEEEESLLMELYYRRRDCGLDAYQMISAGSYVNNISEIHDSYENAVIVMERHFYHTNPVLTEKRSDQGRMDCPLSFGQKDQESFLYGVQSGNKTACISYLEQLKNRILKHDTTLVQVIKNYYFHLALLILQNRKDSAHEEISEYYLWELFYKMNHLEKLHQFLTELLNNSFPNQQVAAEKDSISEILSYINRNLHNPGLSLTEISREYYMSVTYLCMYFKEKTGTTLKAYVIDCRMKKAKELLSYTNLKVSEVAEAVGFADQGYFTKSFSRYFGVSPSHFKEEKNE